MHNCNYYENYGYYYTSIQMHNYIYCYYYDDYGEFLYFSWDT